MQKSNQASKAVGILKTFGFFFTIIGIIAMALYLGAGESAPSAKIETQSGYKYVDITELDNFAYYTPLPGEKPDPELLAKNSIPETVKNLNGSRVTLTGFIMPVSVDDDGNVEEFALNGSYDRCFYGAPSQINQWIHVKMQPGQYAPFSHSPVTVSGTFEVGELIEDGEVVSLYRMTGDKAVTRQRRMF